MDNKKISTILGTSVIVIIIITVAAFIYKFEQNQPNINQTVVPIAKNKQIQNTSLQEKGIHPDTVSIRTLDVQAQFQENSISHNLEKIYLTPDIADLGSFRNNISVKDKSFLIAEINVRDRRTSGEKRQIKASDFFRLRIDKKDYTPIEADSLYLSPQENGTVYIIFPVEREINKFSLLIGTLSRPRVIGLDFQSKEASILEGVFLITKGFSKEL